MARRGTWITLGWMMALLPAAASAAGLDVKDLAWFAGTWRGAVGTHGVIEESWSPPLRGTMTGVTRSLSMRRAQFYEILVIEQTDDGPVLRLKHFSPGLDGWEEKDESLDYRLVSVSGQKAEFEKAMAGDREHADRITYERTPGDTLIITIHDPGKPTIIRMGRIGD